MHASVKSVCGVKNRYVHLQIGGYSQHTFQWKSVRWKDSHQRKHMLRIVTYNKNISNSYNSKLKEISTLVYFVFFLVLYSSLKQ